MQPHLKKCFEGIYLLDFTPDEEIVAMISAEKENVPLSGRIIPADAKVNNDCIYRLYDFLNLAWEQGK